MKCNKCGVELQEIYKLTEDEQRDLNFLVTTENSIREATNNVDLSQFTDDQVIEFYNAIHTKYSALDASKYFFIRNLCKKLHIDKYETIRDGIVYIHPKSEEK